MRLVLLVAAALAGCGAEPALEVADGGGTFTIDWMGQDTGRFEAPARAEWCEEGRMLEIVSLVGDTGAALALYPRDSLVADSMPVYDPSLGPPGRPAAGVALRVFGQVSVYAGQSRSGWLALEKADRNSVTGHFEAELRGVREPVDATVRGSFRNVPVRPAATPCVPDSSGISSDTALR
jgi:hypothetical protein